jgi:EpsI family protein
MNRRSWLIPAAIAIFSTQAISSRVLQRDPYLPSPPRLADLPLELGEWVQLTDQAVAAEAIEVLGPDDYLARQYSNPSRSEQAELFVAYYKTQLRSKNAHDPKVCLPGAGWNPTESRLDHVTVAATGHSFPVNYYRIKKQDHEQVVLYWFQTPDNVYTFEQELRAHRVWDAILKNRTDMAMVRIIVPVSDKGVHEADNSALQLAQTVYTKMLPYFPATSKKTEKSGS